MVADLKVAAFIRWAFSEGTNDRGGRKEGRKEGGRRREDTAALEAIAEAEGAALVEKEDDGHSAQLSPKVSLIQTMTSLSSRALPLHGLEMKIPAIANVLREARRDSHAAKSPKPAIKEIKTSRERERERERESPSA